MRARIIAFALVCGLLAAPTSAAEDCKGDCPDGYLSVCVKRGSNCKCECAKDVDAAVTQLRELLTSAGVHSNKLGDAETRYRELVSGGDFTFTIVDAGVTYTVIGTGRLRKNKESVTPSVNVERSKV